MTTPDPYPDVVATMPGVGVEPISNEVVLVPTTSKMLVGLDVSRQLASAHPFGDNIYIFAGLPIEAFTVPTNYTATLEDSTGTPIVLANAPSLYFGLITQLIDGSQLTAGKGYTLTVTWEDTSGTGTRVGRIKIRCPF